MNRVQTLHIPCRLLFIGIGAVMAFGSLAGSGSTITPLPEGQILRGRFQQVRFLQGLPAPLKSAGNFTLIPGRGLIWRAETPFVVTTVMTPAGLVQELKDREIARLPSSRLPFMSKLYAMLSGALSGDWAPLAAVFHIVRQDDARNWRMRLEPITADDPTMPIRVITARGSRLLEELEVVKTGGDRDRLVFTNQKLEAAPAKAEELRLLDNAGEQ